MRIRPSRIIIPLLVLLAVVAALALALRARSRDAYGPALALCPGPDQYGYTCDSAAHAYVDATTRTLLYQDDGTFTLDLPFPFTFYGTTYSELSASSNGNLQFGRGNPAFPRGCLVPGPAAGMSDMIAPLWMDLDLRLTGELEYDVVGEAPNRVFIVEWDDVPPFLGGPDDAVTFEVQLIESSNDIIFLYADPIVLSGGNGGAAVVGVQSEAQGLALQFSCFQPVVPVGGALRITHPENPNRTAGLPGTAGAVAAGQPGGPIAKGAVEQLMAELESEGHAALDRLKLHWLGQRPQRAFDWLAADVLGAGSPQLVALWQGGVAQPALAEVAVLSAGAAGREPQLLFQQGLGRRDKYYAGLHLEAAGDVTGDGASDVILRDRPSGQVLVLSVAPGELGILSLPEQCAGSLIATDVSGDGVADIVRDGCEEPGRVAYRWDGLGFERYDAD